MVLPQEGFPRDPKRLIREVDAAIKIKDIEMIQKCRDRVELKWWESGLLALLFVAGLGFIITIYKILPAQNPTLFKFVFFWFLLFVFALIVSIEFLLMKINALRQLNELQTRLITQIEKQLTEQQQQQQETAQPHPEGMTKT